MTAPNNDPPAPRRRHGRTAIIVVVVVLVAAGVVWAATRGDGSADAGAGVVEVDFAEVVRADLVETEDFSGTLGRLEGDPIVSRRSGTVTDAAEAGTTLDVGDVAYRIDEEPVVLMLGDVPVWRALGLDVDTEPVANRSSGTVTALGIDDGAVVSEGDVLYWVDGEPVALLYGEIPAYRTLRRNSEGLDVAQLEAALVGLGFDPDETVTVDEDFTANTEAMVERWQEALGATEDGVVTPGDVVFATGPLVVDTVLVSVGDVVNGGQPVFSAETSVEPIRGADVSQLEQALASLGYDPGPLDGVFDTATEVAVVAWQTDIGAEADGIVDVGEIVFRPDPIRITDILSGPGSPVQNGSAVLATSSAQIEVVVDLPAADQGALAEGDEVVVILPDDSETSGVVTSVGTVAEMAPNGDSMFEVIIALLVPDDATGLDEAPVDVEVVSEARRGVMAVPVTALVALREGGYAVEKDGGDGTTVLVAVEPGFYASGLVEVTSNDLDVGDRVVVP